MKKIFYIFTIAAVALISCSKNDTITDSVINTQSKIVNNGVLIKKVKKLENPYSVANMKKAYTALQQEGVMKAAMNIESTHYYVRFLPQDSTELETLKKDTTLTLYSHPLDYELTEGEKYIDSTLIGNDFTWLYTRVPIGYMSPISKYEVIEELYLPTLVETTAQQIKQQRINAEWLGSWGLLEAKSLELTGNGTDQSAALVKGLKKSAARWWPKATIKVYDDITNTYIPVQGAKVRARWWFNWENGITNEYGVANMSGSFSGKLNWSIVWERANWDIRDGWFLQAYFNGPNGSKSDWDLNIDGGRSKAYATIHRAAMRHVHGDNLGMLRPVNYTVPVQKICYIDKKGTGDYWANVGGGLLPDIRIYGKNSNTGAAKTSNEIFSTTCHELGHAVQSVNMGNVQFWQVSKIIYESWADAVEWALTKKEYQDLGVKIPTGIVDIMNKQSDWPVYSPDKAYSPLFIDLVDDFNQSSSYGSEYPDDNVTGYTMANLSKIALKSYGLSSLKTALKKEKPTGVTDEQIDLLFKKYEEIWN